MMVKHRDGQAPAGQPWRAAPEFTRPSLPNWVFGRATGGASSFAAPFAPGGPSQKPKVHQVLILSKRIGHTSVSLIASGCRGQAAIAMRAFGADTRRRMDNWVLDHEVLSASGVTLEKTPSDAVVLPPAQGLQRDPVDCEPDRDWRRLAAVCDDEWPQRVAPGYSILR